MHPLFYLFIFFIINSFKSNINGVKRLKLGCLSPNTINNNNNTNNTTYSNVLANAAKSLNDCLINSFSSQESNTTINNKFINKFYLNDNDAQSMDSGFGCSSSQATTISINKLCNQSHNDSQDLDLDIYEMAGFSDDSSDRYYGNDRFSDDDDFENLNLSDEDDDDLNDSTNNSDNIRSIEIKNLNTNLLNSSSKNLDLSGCSVNSANSSSYSLQTRRCLFTPTPKQTEKSRQNTPNKLIEIESNKSSPKQQITPITTFGRFNTIIPPTTNSETTDSSFFDYSLIKIESTLNIDNVNLKQNHEMIMQSLEFECKLNKTSESNSLIGDRTRYHILPCKPSIKHHDLNVIEPKTLTNVLNGEYNNQIDKLIIIDSRYPYEFEGGHIRSAQNIYTKEKLIELFIQNRNGILDLEENSIYSNKKIVVIFHCEFSSERGPSMLRFLRNQDRAINRDAYPKLFYPELYLLEGGYKAFYESHRELCDPISYKPMLHEDHVNDLKHFRAKTKTWESQHKNLSAAFSSAYKSSSLNSSIVTKKTRISVANKLQRFPRSTLF